MSDRICDACGKPQAFIHYGGAMLCRTCDVDVKQAVAQARESGARNVSALAEARKIFRSQFSGGDIIVKDVPADLKAAAQGVAESAGLSLREFILSAMADKTKAR